MSDEKQKSNGWKIGFWVMTLIALFLSVNTVSLSSSNQKLIDTQKAATSANAQSQQACIARINDAIQSQQILGTSFSTNSGANLQADIAGCKEQYPTN